jgi:PadR family transcriptional regulator, regulatory protein PadR
MPTSKSRVPLLQGTLDLLVLRSLLFGPMHGHGIVKAIERSSAEQLHVEHGSLYPALHRLERNGWLASKWETAPNGRPMKFYRLTAAGRKQLVVEESKWQKLTRAVAMVLRRAVE